MTEGESFSCSFCYKVAAEVKKLVAGPSVYICDECINLCYGILSADSKAVGSGKKDRSSIPTPKMIKEHLDQYVIGQDAAKSVISVAVYNHYKRLANPTVDDVELEKSNILILGPSGSGKTLLAQSIARFLDVPFAIADATSLTEAGYVGEDVESVVVRLLQAAGQDIEKAQRGIIYIDEIDKKRAKGETGSGTRDVSGEGVQQALLKIIEGTEVYVSPTGRKANGGPSEKVKVDTRNILFIVGGAFVGLEKVVQAELDKNNSNIGFGAGRVGKVERLLSELHALIEPKHLIGFGLIPEMVGRLPIVVALDELNEEQLISIMTTPRNAVVKQFEKLFKLDNIELEFETAALASVAKIAKERKTGARGLRAVIESRLNKTQFELPDLRDRGIVKVIVTENVINNFEEPILIEGEPPEVVFGGTAE
jgi:ATP-dependent Clp protease ATP-binding subunit ClpX